MTQRYIAYGFIKNWGQFIQVLRKLDRLIGYDKPNMQLVANIKSMSVDYRRNGKLNSKEKLHILLLGPPGVGKSVYGEMIAELLAVCGRIRSVDGSSQQPRRLSLGNFEVKKIDPQRILQLQQIAMKDSQIKQLQNTVNRIRVDSVNGLRLLSKLRRKTRGHVPQPEFGEIQNIFRGFGSISGTGPLEILPLTIPQTPGNPIELAPFVPFVPFNTPSDEIKPKFVILTKADLVGKWQGHTPSKLRSLFEEYDGGVIMLDEVYTLITGENDSYGKEALTEIIHYMTTFPDRITFIFAGYRKEIEEGILTFQPGLKRRFKYTFEITGYTPEQLTQIFHLQIQKGGLQCTPEALEKVLSVIKENQKLFRHFGGDTERFSDFVQSAFYSDVHHLAIDDTISQAQFCAQIGNIESSTIESAFEDYRFNTPIPDDEVSDHLRAMLYT